MGITVYKLDGSPPARAVIMTVKALGIPNVEFKDVNILNGENKTEEYLQLNPMHTIPTLKDDDFAIWDSHAIAVYLVSKYGKDDSLYPEDLRERAVVDQRLHFDSGILFVTLRGVLAPVLYQLEKKFRQELLDKFDVAYDFLEKFLTKKWLAGDKFTLADICCVSTATSMNVIVPIDGEKYPKIISWMERCSEFDFVEETRQAAITGLQALVDTARP